MQIRDIDELTNILGNNTNYFTESELALDDAIANGSLIRCDACGRFITQGYTFGDGTDYCSDECRRTAIDDKDYYLTAYGFDADDLPMSKDKMTLQEVIAFAEANGNEDSDYAYFTGWEEVDPNLVAKLNSYVAPHFVFDKGDRHIELTAEEAEAVAHAYMRRNVDAYISDFRDTLDDDNEDDRAILDFLDRPMKRDELVDSFRESIFSELLVAVDDAENAMLTGMLHGLFRKWIDDIKENGEVIR